MSKTKEEIARKNISTSIEHAGRIYEDYRRMLEGSEEPYTEDDITVNVLADVMHYCASKQISFGECLDVAYQSRAHELITAGAAMRGPIERELEDNEERQKEAIKKEIKAELKKEIPLLTDNDLLTEQQAAEILGVNKGSLSVFRSTGRHQIPFVKVGRNVRYRRSDLEAWMEKRVVTHTGQVKEK